MPSGRIDQRVFVGAFALLCMFAGGLLGYKWLSAQQARLRAKEAELNKLYQNPVDVVVAAKDLPEETTVQAGDLGVKTVPERYVQPYYIPASQKDKAIGLITTSAIAKDEQLLKNKLRREEQLRVRAGSTLSSLMPKGKRAVTIAVDAITGVGGFVSSGDIVDILWTIKLPDSSQKGEQVVTLVLFQDVQVLAMGSELPGKGEKEKGASRENNVTLALSPQEASFLLFAREQGKIQLSLRPNKETGHVDIAPANFNTLMQMQLNMGGGEKAPPRVTRQVEIYRGINKKDIVDLPDAQ